MAIEYQNISIGEATAALAGAAAQTAWRDALVGHISGSWILEEEFDVGGHHWVVVKNTGADIDFFVCIGREIATGTLGCMVGEEYVAAANLLSKYAPRSNATGTILADGSYGNPGATTWTLAGALPDNFNAYPFFVKITQSATERLFTCVEADYAVLNVNNDSMYVGALTDLILPKTGLVATPCIGCVWLSGTGVGEGGGITNHPIAAADAPLQCYQPHACLPLIGSPYIDAVCIQDQALLTAIYGYADRYQGDRVAASEIACIMGAAFASSYPGNTAAKVGGLRGKFKGLRYTTAPLAAVKYDTIVIDNRKHVVAVTFGGLTAFNPYFVIATPYQYSSNVQILLAMDTGVPA